MNSKHIMKFRRAQIHEKSSLPISVFYNSIVLALGYCPRPIGLEHCSANRNQAALGNHQNHYFILLYKHFWLAAIEVFALVLALTSDFAARA